MSERLDGRRTIARSWALGALASAALVACAGVFAYLQLQTRTADNERRDVQFVDLVGDEAAADVPLEVIGVRDRRADEAGGSAGGDRIASVPDIPRIEATLSPATTGPAVFLEPVEQAQRPVSPALSYASVSDLLISASPNPRPLRPIDDRPVEVLAAMGGCRGVGIGIGGGQCKPQRPMMFRGQGLYLDGLRPVPR